MPETDVLIVGAGPVGMTLSLLLAKEGCSVTLCERDEKPFALPRAAHLDDEAMRVFQAVGLGERVLAHTRQAARYDFVNADREVLMRFDQAPQRLGWPAGNMIHQPSIEAELRAAIVATPRIDLRTGWTLTTLDAGQRGVEAAFSMGDGVMSLTARYAVGCDGARSAVRKLARIGHDDLGFDEPWLVVDVIPQHPERLPSESLQVCDPARPTTIVPMGRGRHRWEFMLRGDETQEMAMADGFAERLLSPWLPTGTSCSIERKAVYRFHALIAEVWRAGPILLAGDAAHQMPPFAGQGLCSGLRDAANLSWKLGLLLREGADEALLDTYQAEREPHVRHIIATAIMMGQTVCTTDPAAARARDEAMLAARAAGQAPAAAPMPPLSGGAVLDATPGAGTPFIQPSSGGVRLDDELGPGPWLIATTDIPPADEGVPFYALTDERFAPFREPVGQWLDEQGAQAVLVRPDRIVFGTGEPTALASAYQEACGLGSEAWKASA